MPKFGIDISAWQEGFNFDKAIAEGVEFAILRGAYHMNKDRCFEAFYGACKQRNIPVGVYLYSMAKTPTEAKKEADFLINNVLKGKTFEYPIYMDVEDKTQRALGKSLLTEIVVAFCETLENAGYYVGIYSSAAFFKSYLVESKLTRYDKWVAQWYKECTYSGDYGLWQFGGETNVLRTNKVAGVVCDQDYAYKDYPKIIKEAGLNGFSKATDEPKPTVTDSKIKKATDPAASFSRTLAGNYTVTASALNVRNGAGTGKPVMVTIPKGTVVRNYGYYTRRLGVKWLYVQFTYKGVIYFGFASSKYLSKVTSRSSER